MLTRLGTDSYEITEVVLDEDESARFLDLISRPDPEAARRVDEAVERARGRVSGRSLSELLSQR